MKKWILLLLVSASAFAGTQKIVTCNAIFHTTASPGFLSIDSKPSRCYGLLTEKDGLYSGAFQAPVKEFDTGINLRNDHLRNKYLLEKKYPTVEFAFKPQKDDGELEGFLTIKEESKPVSVKYEGKEKVKAKFSFEAKDFPSIGCPSWLGVTACGKIDVEVEFIK